MARNFTQSSLGFILVLVMGFMLNSLTTNAQNCDAPSGLSTTNLSNFSATLNWTPDSSVDHYRLRYKEDGSSTWLFEHNASGASQDILGLTVSTNYIWQAKAFCSVGNSAWSVLDSFTTPNDSVDCNNTPNGTAFNDNCGNCVGGTTGKLECIDFTPTVSISLSTNECNIPADIAFATGQDPNEPDVSSTFVVSDGGFFDFTGLATDDVIGSTVIMAGGGTININATLMVDFVVSPSKITVKAVDDADGSVAASFTIENSAGGILIIATSGTDNNNVTSGNSQLINLIGLFVNPSPSVITFTSTINSELGDIDTQDFSISIECLVFDCNGDQNGTAFTDSCGNCVGGNTGNVACVPFSPTVSISISNTDCDSLSTLTIDVSQDPNEPDMSTSLFTSDEGSFDIINMSVGDNIGTSSGTPGSGISFSAQLVVSSIISSDQAIIQAVDDGSGQVLASFTISNANPGINISVSSIPDGNNTTSGNSHSVTFSNVFVNPGAGSLVFTSTINSELLDQDIQSTSFTISCLSADDCNGDLNGTAFLDDCANCVGGNTGNDACIDFTPTVSITLSNTNCDSLSDLIISVSQDANEPDMSTSLFASNSGSFDISNMNTGDIIGSAIMVAGSGMNTFNTELIVTTIISSDQAIIQSQDLITGQVLGSFTISNSNPGINISAQSIPDGNNTTSGNSQTVTFSNVFVNPGAGSLVFTTTTNSEVGDQDIQSTSFNITCSASCPQLGDANCDGIVNLSDLTLVINHWLQSTAVGTDGDVIGSLDGFVNLEDLTLVINNWLQSTP